MNRGRAELGALVGACRAAGVTDLLVLHETRGRPGTAPRHAGKGAGLKRGGGGGARGGVAGGGGARELL